MLSFDVVFNLVFLTISFYHVFYFMIQFSTIKRIEFFYYSHYLFFTASFYLLYNSLKVFSVAIPPGLEKTLAAFEMSFAFVQNYLYISFIIAYLELGKVNLRIYTLLKYYKLYNLIFLFFFPLLHLLNIDSRSFYGIISILTLPITFVLLFMLWQLNTLYSKIVLYGTTCSVVGTLLSFILITNPSLLKINVFIPSQIGMLLDLIVLGYGLTLKAAESDKKLVLALQENQKLLEVERSRFARDLHDGLGGLLSSVKFSFNNMKEHILLSAPQALSFEQSLLKLDSGIAELRRIAHNMMPENLQQFGLDAALKDFCITIQQGTHCRIHYESFGMREYQANQTTDIAIYRVAQELINNALKHADAKQIIVQLQKTERAITLTVEDNGKGFDASILKTDKGSGWRSIQSRVNLLKGILQVNSTGKGTTVIVEIIVQ